MTQPSPDNLEALRALVEAAQLQLAANRTLLGRRLSKPPKREN